MRLIAHASLPELVNEITRLRVPRVFFGSIIFLHNRSRVISSRYASSAARLANSDCDAYPRRVSMHLSTARHETAESEKAGREWP